MLFDFSSNKIACLFWFFRWLLLFLLFFVLGSFLEGPPIRVVVRSWPFILACVAVPVLTAQFLYQVFRLHFAIVTAPAVAIPAAYIYCAQLYYDGGKSELYELITIILFGLMCLIGVVYLYSLFVIRPRKIREKDPIEVEEPEARHEITLYAVDSEGQCGAVKLHQQGGASLPGRIIIDGFSRALSIDLDEHWDIMLGNDLDDYSTNVTTYETIVKFGETKQLVDNYQIVLKIT